MSTVAKKNGGGAFCCFIVLASLCLIPFWWVPFSFDCFKDYCHFCPECTAFLAVRRVGTPQVGANAM